MNLKIGYLTDQTLYFNFKQKEKNNNIYLKIHAGHHQRNSCSFKKIMNGHTLIFILKFTPGIMSEISVVSEKFRYNPLILNGHALLKKLRFFLFLIDNGTL